MHFQALSRNSTECPIGVGFRISGFRLRFAVLRLRPVGGGAAQRPDETEVFPDETPHRASLQTSGNLSFYERFSPRRGPFPGGRSPDPSHGETTVTEEYMLPKLGWTPSVGQVPAVVRLWPPPEDRDFSETLSPIGSQRLGTAYGCAPNQEPPSTKPNKTGGPSDSCAEPKNHTSRGRMPVSHGPGRLAHDAHGIAVRGDLRNTRIAGKLNA